MRNSSGMAILLRDLMRGVLPRLDFGDQGNAFISDDFNFVGGQALLDIGSSEVSLFLCILQSMDGEVPFFWDF